MEAYRKIHQAFQKSMFSHLACAIVASSNQERSNQETELLNCVGHVRLNADGTCWTLMTAADELHLGRVWNWR